MKLANLSRGEALSTIAGILLGISVFLPWYTTSTNRNVHINSHYGHGQSIDLSAWQVHPILRILLLMAVAAPLILAWIIMREHQLSWARGEVTAIVGITAMTLVFYVGIIDTPGSPQSEVSLTYGWFIALAAGAGLLIGAAMRSSETERTRKPPGTI